MSWFECIGTLFVDPQSSFCTTPIKTKKFALSIEIVIVRFVKNSPVYTNVKSKWSIKKITELFF